MAGAFVVRSAVGPRRWTALMMYCGQNWSTPIFLESSRTLRQATKALDYMEDVWKRARSLSKPLANEVRDVLPTAYAYCLEDCAEDASFLERWSMTIREAVVFDGRGMGRLD